MEAVNGANLLAEDSSSQNQEIKHHGTNENFKIEFYFQVFTIQSFTVRKNT